MSSSFWRSGEHAAGESWLWLRVVTVGTFNLEGLLFHRL
jgi:hypothetical protein